MRGDGWSVRLKTVRPIQRDATIIKVYLFWVNEKNVLIFEAKFLDMKLKYLLFVILFIIDYSGKSQVNQWTWIAGDSTVNQAGNYGVKGIASSANKPPTRSKAIYWNDKSGNLWMMGGRNHSNSGNDTFFNDLWKYDIVTLKWTWISGDKIGNQPGIYGTKRIASSLNKPGARSDATSWTDTSGNLWLFGGLGYTSLSYYEYGNLNDLWEYNISTNQWTYFSGDSSNVSLSSYGIKGVPSSTNCPTERDIGLVWIDNIGNFWLYGGQGYSGNFNDLWKFDISTNYWCWINGDSTANAKTIYGIKGITSPSNKFGARYSPINWKDKQGNFWFMGGNQSLGNIDSMYSDIWKYNISINQWTWMFGDSLANKPPVYGTKLVPSLTNCPGIRLVSSIYEDNADNLWLFGGFTFKSSSIQGMTNELWKYNKNTYEWTWVSGDSTLNLTGSYGTKGIATSQNKPGSRYFPYNWSDNLGNLWIIGGQGFGNSTLGNLNDIWKFTPGNGVKYNLIGNIISPKHNSVKNVDLIINGINNVDSTGTYSLSLSSGNYTLSPTKNNDINKANGVTAIDLAITQAHVLGKALLNSPYKIIAADVNGDGKVTALDLVYMKRLILGIDTTFTNTATKETRLWTFVDSSYKFADSTNPFPFKDSIIYTNLNANQINQTFIGIKLGDVNWDWNPAQARMKSPSLPALPRRVLIQTTPPSKVGN